MDKQLLELSQIGRFFLLGDQTFYALKDINLTINTGEFIAITGASGSGKTTLLNILGCLDKPNIGEYKIAGQNAGNLSNEELAALRREYFGFVFQQNYLLPYLNACQNVEMPAIYAGVDKTIRYSRAKELLVRLGLKDYCEHLPNQLSGGQQQRVCIARALINNCDIILADEPTGALDSNSGQEIINILHELYNNGRTIIMVTHNLKLTKYAERIIELKDGEIISDHHATNTILKKPIVLEETITSKANNDLLKVWQYFIEATRMAIITMLTHRLRAILTMLGIGIGITAVVIVVALGQGTQEKIIAYINSLGTNIIVIHTGNNWGDENAKNIHTLTLTDMSALKMQPYVDSITPWVINYALLRYKNITANARVAGIDPQYFRVRGVKIEQGRAFVSQDIQDLSQVAIIDDNTRKKLFQQHDNPLNNIIFVNNIPCHIIGVIKTEKFLFWENQDLAIWLPYSTVMGKLLNQQYLVAIGLRIKEGLSIQKIEKEVIKLLTLRHKNKDFFTHNQDFVFQTVSRTTIVMVLLISAIAIISLIVGGIGVMNIMLVSVSERIREIGVRMAVGARQIDILQQFLIEAVILCLMGGIFGIILAYGINLIFSLFVNIITIKISIVLTSLACLSSSLLGILFGFIPARNAARLDPIVALSRE
jgi:macrolide transport system ATP-binding/permease protein